VLDRVVDNFFAETEQVAFCTQNIVPGIDFTDDPLLQGRNFSYLDTQLKRLGSPNFTHLPINAPKCPFAHFQQDGHMAFHNPKGRVNYEPNSWSGANEREQPGPREDPANGFKTFPQPVEGPKLRARPETFADHYSQARQFYVSQADLEKTHIANALTFELSKVETPAIRSRMVSHLLNIDEKLADQVAKGLRLKEMPAPATPARPPIKDLKPSDALSILKNGPKSFAGRVVGALVTDGVDAAVLSALAAALEAEGAKLKLIAPEVGGVEDSAGNWRAAQEKLEGGPSVLFDAVAILPSEAKAALLATLPAARDFVADAVAHRKFLGYASAATPLFERAGVADMIDEGFVPLNVPADAEKFLAACRKVRFWERANAER
jgi:catalase